MPQLKTRMIFISHAWMYSSHYWTVVEWFHDAPHFDWKNCSVPNHDSLPDTTKKGLMEAITRQIKPAQAVVILAGMYATHSDWIEYEIAEAQRMDKSIVGVKPWGQERVPKIVQDAADIMVGWNSASVIQAVRLYT